MPKSPKRIENYELLDRIDETGGGQGRVHRARYVGGEAPGLSVGDFVAVKILHHMADEDDARRFKRETKILGKMDHRNIVRYRDSFVWSDDLGEERGCLVMELLEGETLKSLLRRHPDGLPWEQVDNILSQVLKALQYASLHGVIHRDLKPSNIMITSDGLVKLIDFGIARHRSGDETATSTGAGVVGSPDYMAPDFVRLELQGQKQFRGDEQSDVFSFGICLYQALTGRLPFPSLTDAHGFYARWFATKPPEVEFKHPAFRVLSHARSCIAKCVNVHRDARYQSFEQVAADFERIKRKKLRHNDEEYEFLQYLGHGGFGEVYKARRLRDGCHVAIKRLTAVRHSRRFVKEARILQNGSHPHLVKYLDFAEVQGVDDERQFFLVLEYLEGMPHASLHYRIHASDGGLDPVEALRLFTGYLDCLEQLHRQGIIHRDIKPANLYAPEGNPSGGKIFDLGIAHDEEGTRTHGQVPGTLNYMPPEFATEEKDRGSPQSDIYSVGVTLYQTLVKELPFPEFPNNERGAWIQYFKRGEKRTKCPLGRGVAKEACLLQCEEEQKACPLQHPLFQEHPELVPVLRRALAHDPGQRQDSAGRMRDELQEILSSWLQRIESPTVSVSDKRVTTTTSEQAAGFLEPTVARKIEVEPPETKVAEPVEAPQPAPEEMVRPRQEALVGQARTEVSTETISAKVPPDAAERREPLPLLPGTGLTQPPAGGTEPTKPADLEKARQELEAAEKGKPQPPEGGGQPYLDEDVQFTTYTPAAVQPQKPYRMLAFAHLSKLRPDAPAGEPDPLEEVQRQAREILANQIGEYQGALTDSQRPVPREGELTFVPQMPGIAFDPPQRTFHWRESVHREEFELRASPRVNGQTVQGRLTVFLGGIILAEISLSIRVERPVAVEPRKPEFNAAHARPYRKIFASYSHQDAAVVEQFESYARALGDRYLRDCVDLRAGEAWSDRLEELVQDADVFQLFWSSNSMISPFVKREWSYARTLRRPNFIRPTYWEEPCPPIPEELREIHFQRLTFAPGLQPLLFESPTQRTSATLLLPSEVERLRQEEEEKERRQKEKQERARAAVARRQKLQALLTRALPSARRAAWVAAAAALIALAAWGVHYVGSVVEDQRVKAAAYFAESLVTVRPSEFPVDEVSQAITQAQQKAKGASHPAKWHQVKDRLLAHCRDFFERIVSDFHVATPDTRPDVAAARTLHQQWKRAQPLAGYVDIPPENYADTERMMQERLNQLCIARLVITSNPPRAAVFLDGTNYLGRTPTNASVAIGPHQLLARYPGLEELRESLELKPGIETRTNHLEFPYGGLQIDSEPAGASVLLDGKPVGTTPFTTNVFRPGEVAYALQKDGYLSATGRVLVAKTLQPVRVPLTQATEGVQLTSDPDHATVFCGDQELGVTPLTKPLPVGRQILVARYPGLLEVTNSVEVKRGQLSSARFAFQYGRLEIASEPPGASVSVNGRAVGATPYLTDPIGPGEAVYSLQLEGYNDLIVRTNVLANARIPVSVTLTRAMENVQLSSDPAGAQVLWQGEALGVTPLTKRLPVGRHELVARYRDLPDVTHPVEVRRGQSASAHFGFQYGRIKIESAPSRASVFLDGELKGTTPYTNDLLKPGPALYTLRLENYHDFRTNIVVMANTRLPMTMSVTLAPVTESVELTSDPPGATVWRENQELGKTPLTLALPLGQPKLIARYDGLSDVTQSVEIKRGQPASARFGFQYGRIKIESTPSGASVMVGNKPVGITPYTNDVVKPGPTPYTLRLPDHEEFSTNVVIVANARLPTTVTAMLKLVTSGVQLTSDPPGATVFWQGNELGKTPVLRRLSVGRYELVARFPGLSEVKRSVQVRSGQPASANFPFSYGGLEITSDKANAEVFVNGKLLDRTPYTNRVVAPGPLVCMVKAGTLSKELTLSVSAGQTNKFHVVLRKPKGVLLVSSDPPGATISWRSKSGEQTLGMTGPTPLRTEPIDQGQQTLVAQHSVLGVTETNVFVRADGEVPANIAFAYGSVWVRAEPASVEAKVLRGGKVLGTTPYFDPVVKPGRVTYDVQAPNYQTTNTAGLVQAGRSAELLAMLVKVPPPPTPAPVMPAARAYPEWTNSVGMVLVKVAGVPGIGDCWVGKYEVTQQEYQKVMGQNPSKSQLNPRMPVEFVSFNDALEFCNRLNNSESGGGLRYTLPTETQWEHLVADARLEDSVTSKGRETRRDHPEVVGSEGTKPNKFGLFDIRGNVSELCDSPGEIEKRARGGAFDGQLDEGLFGTLGIDFRGNPLKPDAPAMKAGFRILGIGSPRR